MKLHGVLRGRWAVLGLLAMLAALLQPLCAAYAATQDVDHEAVQCCADVETGAVVASPVAMEVAKGPMASPLTIVAPSAGTPSTAAHSYRRAAWNDPPLLPSLPYHARSARIQR
jgi:hypothetical protein